MQIERGSKTLESTLANSISWLYQEIALVETGILLIHMDGSGFNLITYPHIIVITLDLIIQPEDHIEDLILEIIY